MPKGGQGSKQRMPKPEESLGVWQGEGCVGCHGASVWPLISPWEEERDSKGGALCLKSPRPLWDSGRPAPGFQAPGPL